MWFTRRDRRERDLDDEIAAHLRMAVEDRVNETCGAVPVFEGGEGRTLRVRSADPFRLRQGFGGSP